MAAILQGIDLMRAAEKARRLEFFTTRVEDHRRMRELEAILKEKRAKAKRERLEAEYKAKLELFELTQKAHSHGAVSVASSSAREAPPPPPEKTLLSNVMMAVKGFGAQADPRALATMFKLKEPLISDKSLIKKNEPNNPAHTAALRMMAFKKAQTEGSAFLAPHILKKSNSAGIEASPQLFSLAEKPGDQKKAPESQDAASKAAAEQQQQPSQQQQSSSQQQQQQPSQGDPRAPPARRRVKKKDEVWAGLALPSLKVVVQAENEAVKRQIRMEADEELSRAIKQRHDALQASYARVLHMFQAARQRKAVARERIARAKMRGQAGIGAEFANGDDDEEEEDEEEEEGGGEGEGEGEGEDGEEGEGQDGEEDDQGEDESEEEGGEREAGRSSQLSALMAARPAGGGVSFSPKPPSEAASPLGPAPAQRQRRRIVGSGPAQPLDFEAIRGEFKELQPRVNALGLPLLSVINDFPQPDMF